MATTTNYGWTTPDDTALVKDGASAIRTLGTSVDTTTKNLNPETTLADLAYRSSTANVKTRLGIGSTGQVLTVAGGVPTWATPAATGGLTLINTASFSAVSGFAPANGTFSATYDNYRVLISDITPASGNLNLFLRYRTAGTDNSTSSYYSQEFRAVNSTLSSTYNNGSNSYFVGVTGAGGTSSITIDFLNPFATKMTDMILNNSGWISGTGSSLGITNGIFQTTTSFDSFSLLPASSTISGVCSVYGYNK